MVLKVPYKWISWQVRKYVSCLTMTHGSYSVQNNIRVPYIVHLYCLQECMYLVCNFNYPLSFICILIQPSITINFFSFRLLLYSSPSILFKIKNYFTGTLQINVSCWNSFLDFLHCFSEHRLYTDLTNPLTFFVV